VAQADCTIFYEHDFIRGSAENGETMFLERGEELFAFSCVFRSLYYGLVHISCPDMTMPC